MSDGSPRGGSPVPEVPSHRGRASSAVGLVRGRGQGGGPGLGGGGRGRDGRPRGGVGDRQIANLDNQEGIHSGQTALTTDYRVGRLDEQVVVRARHPGVRNAGYDLGRAELGWDRARSLSPCPVAERPFGSEGHVGNGERRRAEGDRLAERNLVDVLDPSEGPRVGLVESPRVLVVPGGVTLVGVGELGSGRPAPSDGEVLGPHRVAVPEKQGDDREVDARHATR